MQNASDATMEDRKDSDGIVVLTAEDDIDFKLSKLTTMLSRLSCISSPEKFDEEKIVSDDRNSGLDNIGAEVKEPDSSKDIGKDASKDKTPHGKSKQEPVKVRVEERLVEESKEEEGTSVDPPSDPYVSEKEVTEEKKDQEKPEDEKTNTEGKEELGAEQTKTKELTEKEVTEEKKDQEKPEDEKTNTEGKEELGAEQTKTEELTDSDENLDEYNFKHKARGMFILFNVVNFDHQKTMKREGTDMDASLLEKTFHSLGFEVMRFDDPSAYEMKEILKQVAAYDHKDVDCVSVGILTHGTWTTYKRALDHNATLCDIVLARDQHLRLEELTGLFRAKHCHPTLIGKPKLFFIQACRGEKLSERAVFTEDLTDAPENIATEAQRGPADHGDVAADQPSYQTQTSEDQGDAGGDDGASGDQGDALGEQGDASGDQDDAPDDHVNGSGDHKEDGVDKAEAFFEDRTACSLPESMPIYKDFLVAWSAAPGFFSFRNSDKGSVFIQNVCKYLGHYASTNDLLSVLTWANGAIAYDYQSFAPSTRTNPAKRDIHEKKQMPWFFSRLTKDIYLRPKQRIL